MFFRKESPRCWLKVATTNFKKETDGYGTLFIRDRTPTDTCPSPGGVFELKAKLDAPGHDFFGMGVANVSREKCESICQSLPGCDCVAYQYDNEALWCWPKYYVLTTSSLPSSSLFLYSRFASLAPAEAPRQPAVLLPPLPPPPPVTARTAGPSMLLAVGLPVGLVAILACLFAVFLIFRKRRGSPAEEKRFEGLEKYSYETLRAATSDFEHRLGEGASAEVFRAKLGGQMVAVKRLRDMTDVQSWDVAFSNEAEGLGRLLHVNVVRLLGYSADPGSPKMLVYEFLAGGSLQVLLYGKDGQAPPLISFERRMVIAQGIARGIEYCHHLIHKPLIHRDIKPANVLMTSSDANGIPKVADFGLAKILNPTDGGPPSHAIQVGSKASSSGSSQSTTTSSLAGVATTAIVGTPGYIDPECLIEMRQPTLKSDVYSFGVLLLELIMGIRTTAMTELLMSMQGSDSHSAFSYAIVLSKILGQWKDEYATQLTSALGDTELSPDRCRQALTIAHQCLQATGKKRPTMRKVAHMFERFHEGEDT